MPKSKPGLTDAAARRNLASDPPTLHGPYIQWTRTVAGKTVTKFLTAQQLDRYQTWFDNARRLRELVSKLEAASLLAMETAEGWTDKP